MKAYLKQASKARFGSDNSEAHISICEFRATHNNLRIAEKHITHFCTYFKPFTAKFDATAYFTHKDYYTYYLAPNSESRISFEHIMKKINNHFPGSKVKKVSNPHLTIGRELNQSQLHIALKKWENTEFNLAFVCDHIALRKFNPLIGQFSVINTYIFKAEDEWILF